MANIPSGDQRVHRINLVLSEAAFADLTSMAKGQNKTMTEVVRIGLGLAKLHFEESKIGNRLMVVNKDNTAVKEIVLPC